MKAKRIVAIIITFIVLIATAIPAFASIPTDPGTSPFDGLFAEIENLWAKINGDVMVEGESIGLLDNDEKYITNALETDPTVPTSVKSITSDDIDKWNTYWDNTYSIPAAAFVPASSQGCINVGWGITCAEDAGSCKFVAPIQLPNGVTVAELVLYVSNTEDGGQVSVSFMGFNHVSIERECLYTHTFNDECSPADPDVVALGEPINGDNLYWMEVEIDEGPRGFIEAQIHYVYTEPSS